MVFETESPIPVTILPAMSTISKGGMFKKLIFFMIAADEMLNFFKHAGPVEQLAKRSDIVIETSNKLGLR